MRNTQKRGAFAGKRFLHILCMSAIAATATSLQTKKIANQDIAELTGAKSETPWLIHLEQPHGQSFVKAELIGTTPGVDSKTITHSIFKQT